MRQQVFQNQWRKYLLWFCLGFVVVQLGLALGQEHWQVVRDPDFDDVQRLVAARRAEAPTRPLFLALGSSRTLMALRAEKLNRPAKSAPLAINCAFAGAGPMMHQIVLRRLLAAGHRPSRVFVEVMPMSLAARGGAPIEDRQLVPARLTAAEVAFLWPNYLHKYRLVAPWAFARLLPCDRSQAELHDALGIDKVPGQGASSRGRDAYGWSPQTRTYSRDEIEAHRRFALNQYDGILSQRDAAPRAVQALRNLATLCRDHSIAVEFVMPPEGSLFRSHVPAVARIQADAVRNLARELGVNSTDARTWIDDDGFWDGHHATIQGADQYTERFYRELLLPHIDAGSVPSAATVANRPESGGKAHP